uniref:Uncharacterized protein n=1 Tax=Anopheles dirus TaxID=7168 RepID=A0A182NGM3_9DIPT
MKCWDAGLLLVSAGLLLSQVVHGLSVRPRRDLLEKGKTVVLQGAAKLKEAIDHGVSVKSEGKRSIDLFGIKFGGGSSVNAGFGDAANEGASENDDDLVRRRRAVDVLGAAHAVSLLPQSPFGTNVNIVKVSAVSNVNNYEQPAAAAAPAATTAAAPAARRKRSHNMLQLGSFEKKSFKVDSELTPDNKLRTHESLEMVRGGSRVLLKESGSRKKRTPQSTDDGGDENTSGGPPKGRPRGGPRGPHGPRGPCRGGPPPEDDENSTTTAATVERRKRDTIKQEELFERSKRSPKGPEEGAKRASCRGGGQSTPAPSSDAGRRKRDASHEDSDYSEHGSSEESSESHTQRKRRQALGGDMPGKVGSWFEQLAGVFVDTVKKVVDVTKKSFGRGQAQS